MTESLRNIELTKCGQFFAQLVFCMLTVPLAEVSAALTVQLLSQLCKEISKSLRTW